MAKGIRVSPGVYKDAKTGKTYQSTTGALPKGMKDSPKKNKGIKGLTQNENTILQQQQTADMAVGETRQDLTGRVDEAYADPYNYEGPGPAQYNPEERARIEQELMGRFERYDSPRRQQENDDLARWAQSTGNSVDSPAYAARQKQLADQQNARALDYQSQSVSQGLQEAQGQFGMSSDAFNQNLGYYNQTRDRPIGEYANVQGLIQSSPGVQEYGYQTRLQQQGANQQMNLLNASKPSGGGSRGGGMTAPPQTLRPVPNFTQQPQQPSFWSQAASSLAGPLVNSFGQQAGKYVANSLFS
jgi:hypothetical protein